MPKLALLLSTDDWDKIQLQKKFLESHPTTIWRTRQRYTPEYLKQIRYPLNLYFFHRSNVEACAHCLRIERIPEVRYRVLNVPPEFHDDPTPYSIFIEMDKVVEVTATHIRDFPKWDDPETCFDRGQFGLLKVIDIFAR